LGAEGSVKIIQATEFILSQEQIKKLNIAVHEQLKNCPKQARERLRLVVENVESAISVESSDYGEVFSGLFDSTVSIFELLRKDTVIVFDEAKRVYDLAILNQREFEDRFISLYNSGEIFSFMKNNFRSVEFVMEKIKNFRTAAIQTLSTAIPFFNPLKIVNPTVSAVSDYHLKIDQAYADISNWLYSGYSVLVCAGDAKRADGFSYELSSKGIASIVGEPAKLSGVTITSEKLSRGFVFHEEKMAVVGSGNLFTKLPARNIRKSKTNAFFNAPEIGDYCVHETHGIGKVLGNRKISTTEGTKDYVSVEYYGGDILYVPVEQMDILTRYLGGEKNPRLSKIGGKDFERIKNSAIESIKKMSFDLKKLYNERQSLVGYKFTEFDELQTAFNDAFHFDETPDQLSADSEIKEDMTSEKVMDRLVCGDVGFGKTEVALRAVFRAIANGKQAAMLAPTTILTEQHYSTAIERFKDFGVRIACLNRFRTAKQQTEIIEKIKAGEIDFVIGTHRLLSKDVKFNDLGLLVLDEEQRFGVEHKEKIKLLKKNVDTLTLTATPIPRTLHMSLSGIRSISTINTPPKKRLPVQTFVTEQTDAVIKDAIIREINRGGQVFILYNRVESIFKFADYVKGLLPELKIIVAHGQMEEKTLEKNILSFYNGEANALISTTIIENGIDLPNANTIIVIDADNLGLSTLYQLKGRVGRSDRLAYAYFTFKRQKILSDTAFERLNAITDFTEMGSGIKIAMRDLEIRGAGNILGAEQHGHMDKIGYELYSKLLKEELSGKTETVPELDIRVSAFIPDGYIESNVSRMDAYKQIAEINSRQSEKEFIDYAEETYGKLPFETENLINIAVVKMLAGKLFASEIKVSKEETSIAFDSIKVFSDQRLSDAIEKYKGGITVSMDSKPKIKFSVNSRTNSEMLAELKRFLTTIL
ncbi:MAG: transcription-repair coupling factor, partial [Clostridia bacterium]|nr:transcription-repair coupling factor [Clostridia bacterium]